MAKSDVRGVSFIHIIFLNTQTTSLTDRPECDKEPVQYQQWCPMDHQLRSWWENLFGP